MTTSKKIVRKKSQEKFPRDNSERPFMCDSCGRGFYRLEHKKRHLKIHTGEKPYKCGLSHCMKSFSRSDELRRHSKIHISSTISFRKKTAGRSASQFIPLTPVSSMSEIANRIYNAETDGSNTLSLANMLASLKQAHQKPMFRMSDDEGDSDASSESSASRTVLPAFSNMLHQIEIYNCNSYDRC